MENQDTSPKRPRQLNRRLAILTGILACLLILYLSMESIEFYSALLLKREAVQLQRIQEEYSRLAKEPTEYIIDTQSQIYPVAKSIQAKQQELLQCDGNPSISVGVQKGYRMLFRIWHPCFDHTNPRKAKRIMPYVIYTDIALFKSKDVSSANVKQRLEKDRHPSSKHTDSYYLGAGDGYYWFANASLATAIDLQKQFSLNNGEDLFACLVNDLKDSSSHELLYKLPLFSEKQALPVLSDYIEHHNNRSDCFYATLMLAKFPGPDATNLLLSVYDKYDKNRGTGIVPDVLSISGLREGAKRIYMDMLEWRTGVHYGIAINASIQFHWTEAIPLLKKQMEHPYLAGWFSILRRAVRALEGDPVPDELEALTDSIRNDAASLKGEFDGDKYIRKLLAFQDTEAVMLTAIELATMHGKIVGEHSLNACGKAVLCRLPASQVRPVLEHLAKNVRSEHSRKEAQKLLGLHNQRSAQNIENADAIPFAFKDFLP